MANIICAIRGLLQIDPPNRSRNWMKSLALTERSVSKSRAKRWPPKYWRKTTKSLASKVPSPATSPKSGRACWWPGRQERGRCPRRDRKSTRLNSSHGYISYAVFCLKKKKKQLIRLSQKKKKKKNKI